MIDRRRRVGHGQPADRTAAVVQWLWATAIGLTSGFRIQGIVNVGAPLAVLTVPAVVRRLGAQPWVRWPRVILGLFAAAVLLMPVMSVIGLLVDPARSFSGVAFAEDLVRIVSLGLVVCGILWSCTKARAEWVMATVSVGIAVRYLVFPDVAFGELFKFRLGPTLPFIVLALAARAPRPVQVGALVLVAGMSAMFNLRASLVASAVGAIALTASIVIPLVTRSRRPTRATTAVALVLTAVSLGLGALTVPQLAEDGYFGSAIQQRQVSQEQSSVGIFGARIEPGATWGLLRHEPWGLGPGVMPSDDDRQAAWQGLRELGVDPYAGDFNAHYMRDIVADRIFLHSNLAEFWWHYGPPGAALILTIGAFTGFRLVEQLTRRDPYLTGMVLYVTTRSLWDCLFEPVLPIGTNLMVTTGFLLWLHLERRRTPPEEPVATPTPLTRRGRVPTPPPVRQNVASRTPRHVPPLRTAAASSRPAPPARPRGSRPSR